MNPGSSQPSHPELSIVVLCYRAEESIVPFVEKIEKELHEEHLTNYELVLVANYYSRIPDRTPQIVGDMARRNPKIVCVAREKQGMMGWDLRDGLVHATGDALAIIDGDGQMPPADIVRLYRVFRSGEFDLCKTFRIKRYDGLWRKIVSLCFNGLFGIIFPGGHFRDINSKPKIISRSAYEKMRLVNDNWFSDAEIMLEARRLGLNVGEIPTVFNKNEWRASFVSSWTIVEFFGNLVRYRFKYWFLL